VARPLGQPGTWVGESDYPTGELRLGHAGAVGFSLTIGSAGQVTGCTVTRSSGYRALDEATCRLLARRARFEPARDEQGLPAAGAYASTVRWQIPD
jgi:protein TonB